MEPYRVGQRVIINQNEANGDFRGQVGVVIPWSDDEDCRLGTSGRIYYKVKFDNLYVEVFRHTELDLVPPADNQEALSELPSWEWMA